MTRQSKEMYVSGVMDGVSSGSLSLCQALRDRAPVQDGSCMSSSPKYTHGNPEKTGSFDYVAPYVVVIDDFYKHSECRAMPYWVLIAHLNDAEFKTGDELYKFVRSGNASWGFFSGIDGIDDCYNADRKH